jgi:hypothetical protein
MVHRTDLAIHEVTKCDGIVAPLTRLPPAEHIGMFRAEQSSHFHGRTLRKMRAEIELTGVRLCAGKGSKTAPFGVPSPFALMKTRKPADWGCGFSMWKIWRPAVSGTGGIQDDRIAGRQKP